MRKRPILAAALGGTVVGAAVAVAIVMPRLPRYCGQLGASTGPPVPGLSLRLQMPATLHGGDDASAVAEISNASSEAVSLDVSDTSYVMFLRGGRLVGGPRELTSLLISTFVKVPPSEQASVHIPVYVSACGTGDLGTGLPQEPLPPGPYRAVGIILAGKGRWLSPSVPVRVVADSDLSNKYDCERRTRTVCERTNGRWAPYEPKPASR